MVKKTNPQFLAYLKCIKMNQVSFGEPNEKRKRRNSLKWEEVFQSTKTLVFTLDADRYITSINPATLKTLGLSESEVLGKKCYDLLYQQKPPDNYPFEKSSKTKQMETTEIEMGRAHKAFLVSCTPLLNKKGEIIGALHLATDFTERKRAEEEFKKRNELYNYIANLITDYTYAFSVSPKGELTGYWLSPSFTKVFGYTTEEIKAQGG